MPGRLLGLLNGAHQPSAAAHPQLKSPLSSKAVNASTTSLSIEREKEARVKAKSKKDKEAKEKDTPRRPSITMDALKRHSIVGRPHSKEPKHRRPEGKPEVEKAATIRIKEESPPLLFIGPPTDPNGEDSTGALFSSQLQLDVLVPSMTLTSYDSRLVCVVKHTHPVEKHCPDCTTKTTELKHWAHITEPRTYKKGMYAKPLQYLFPGHLPATITVHGALATLEYRLETVARTSEGEELKNVTPLHIKRAIVPGQDKHSVRIFPPTSVIVNVQLQPVVHPIGEIPIHLDMSGITETHKDSIRRWRLRKLNWRIEEEHKMVSPACPKHAAKVGGDGKGVQHEETRSVGQGELKDGWKTDFADGTIVCEFKAAVNPNQHPVCDTEAPNGLKVTHALIVELVVAEEWAPKNRPNQITPTGAARILKTQFTLVLTERMGMGIAWDQEMPPTYEDVPPSPPGYEPYKAPPSPPGHRRGSVGDFDAASLRELDLEQGLGDLDLRRERTTRDPPARGRPGLSAEDLEDPHAGPSSSASGSRPVTASSQAPTEPEVASAHGSVN